MPRFTPDAAAASPGGEPTGAWAEDATVGDDPVVGPVLGDDAEASDDLVVAGVLPEDATVGDDLTAEVVPSFAEDAQVGDDLTAGPFLADDATVDDAMSSSQVSLADDAQVGDDLSAFGLLADDVTVNDLVKATVAVSDTSRTGTPSSDLLQDAHVVQATPTTNFGSTTPMVVQAADLGNNSQRMAFIEVDLTRFASMTAQASTPFTLSFKARTGSLVAVNLSYDLRSHTSIPFVEDSVTWNTRPVSLGTSRASGTISIAAGAGYSTYTITLTQSQLDSALTDGWAYVQFSHGDTTLRPEFFIKSREDSSGERPTVDLLLQRGT